MASGAVAGGDQRIAAAVAAEAPPPELQSTDEYEGGAGWSCSAVVAGVVRPRFRRSVLAGSGRRRQGERGDLSAQGLAGDGEAEGETEKQRGREGAGRGRRTVGGGATAPEGVLVGGALVRGLVGAVGGGDGGENEGEGVKGGPRLTWLTGQPDRLTRSTKGFFLGFFINFLLIFWYFGRFKRGILGISRSGS